MDACGPGRAWIRATSSRVRDPCTLQLGATNAAGVQSLVSETLSVDNEPVSVSLSTPNDSNPSVWVNHAVTVDATASAGPSGIGSVTCSVDRAAATNLRAGRRDDRRDWSPHRVMHRDQPGHRPSRQSEQRYDLHVGQDRRDAPERPVRAGESIQPDAVDRRHRRRTVGRCERRARDATRGGRNVGAAVNPGLRWSPSRLVQRRRAVRPLCVPGDLLRPGRQLRLDRPRTWRCRCAPQSRQRSVSRRSPTR